MLGQRPQGPRWSWGFFVSLLYAVKFLPVLWKYWGGLYDRMGVTDRSHNPKGSPMKNLRDRLREVQECAHTLEVIRVRAEAALEKEEWDETDREEWEYLVGAAEKCGAALSVPTTRRKAIW